ncbi:MAG: orotidine-5-phosphate decarboxylase [Epulopiscium sp.]|uniref:Orotidine 5'-phosphate decarboxylase n=1 Tax=Defluviitalea raffinosedens TaxID=1450156 RepID=A0A7C8LGC8_9FIRM|nr:orotidine-5'-phosphate decarboxylase [Defluviitalea raffinosedens]MBZ4668433.1 orotidine 5-phosphate decarboxylase [Defluviitaleaceae bacterium]MDK2787656.1 orotidine-5-phosphate decarboxylase [Candidatus Epulonipiscium sp.]KAE9636315.1 orotidine-5'-phosphate decarboxylase [Defluviitalea raffinosedens]MBM7685382.1 orotidine-5'-phosphate decarboxylase [Defluviitalea raffinosedens]HHW66297.1 orotidine-5'-phosphate decarboxylase [Candidatus Epulonipiscium sp.]
MIDRLIEKIEKTKNPTVVGLDPRLGFVPGFIKEEAYELYGKTPKAAARAFYEFNKAIIDAVYDLVPAVKPQVAMYEQYGPEGIKAYIDTILYAKEKGLVVIGDVKRSDIASTAEAYADGHIGRVKVEDEVHEVYHEDSITLNPYLGYDSIEPYMNHCKAYDKGLFILVKTSNPNSGEIQDLDVGEEKLYERVGRLVSKWGEAVMGKRGYSHIGAVVGATYPEQGTRLRQLMPHTFFLVPGYGAQGATAKDLAGCFDQNGLGAIVNSSRGIIAAYQLEKYKNKFSDKEFAQAAREAVIDMRKDLERVL